MKSFGSLGAFAEHIAAVAVAEAVAARVVLGKAAEMVEHRAKEKIGEYQAEAGPFMAWADLADATKEDRARQGYPEDEPLLRAGDMRDSIGHIVAVDSLEAQIGSNSDIAVYQELGTSKIPPRSFLGGAMAEKLPEIKEMIGLGVVAALLGEGVHRGALRIRD